MKSTMMRKLTIFAIVSLFCTISYAQRPGLKGLSVGLGIPIEFTDLEAAGLGLHVGFDRTYPISDRFALGFYISGGGSFLAAFHPYNEYDRFYYNIKVSAGFLMEVGDLNKKPFIIGVGPCTGFGLLDMDLVLPIEVRFGRVLGRWYMMGELTYGYSLAGETICFEPSVRVGYRS